MSKVDVFLKKTLGEDFLQSLHKFELWKPGTKSVVDHEELRTALQIVPRTVIALLIKELTPMAIGETKEIALFVSPTAILKATKHERDVYSGEIEEDNKKIVDFKFRALPGVGLVIMSAFELYDMENLINSPQEAAPEQERNVQRMIDERLSLHDLIGKVVDKKIMEKEAIHQLVLAKLTEAIQLVNEKVDRNHSVAAGNVAITNMKVKSLAEKVKKARPLQEFLAKRKPQKEFSIELAKGESFSCPDCRKSIFDGAVFSGCICLGDDRERKVFIKKSEDGVKVRFSRGWDPENMEMLLEILQKKR